MLDFATTFEALTGNPPFPWQRALYDEWFSQGKIPQSCNLSTGLGKTSVIAIWLIALANHPDKMPRRLVYVVNRRTVVDQTTDEVEKYKERKVEDIPDFAVSTLRGQFADNREWSIDPSRPAVICGTVDMIGSRLLFNGYGVGWKAKPLHAGFLGQDTLLVHDEAHLEPAFQTLIERIENEQGTRVNVTALPWPRLKVMELTATSRGKGKVFELTADDKKNPTVNKRLSAKKQLRLHAVKDEKKLADQLVELALQHKDSRLPVLIYTRKVEDVVKIHDRIKKEKLLAVMLTGTMRGKERDEMASENVVFRSFLPNASDVEQTCYLVCTSAGEVGVNISAHHMVCDLSTFESMAQRFGRINRFGLYGDSLIDVVHPMKFDADDAYAVCQERTLKLMQALDGDASPSALGKLPVEERQIAFAPTPVILPVSDMHLDAWSLTTIRDRLPGRPHVEPYLHGLSAEWQPPETQVAWREEVDKIDKELQKKYPPNDLLDDYPIKPKEVLREPSYRAYKAFVDLAKRHPNKPAWLVDDEGKVAVITIEELADKDKKEQIEGSLVLLPPSAGGLQDGLLQGSSEKPVEDVSEIPGVRLRLDGADPDRVSKTENLRLLRRIDFTTSEADEDADTKSWLWFEKPYEGGSTDKSPVEWKVHVEDVEREMEAIIKNLPLSEWLRQVLKVAAKYHDHGKKRERFQTVLGNTKYPDILLAKAGKQGKRLEEKYRHEFGSLFDIASESDFKQLDADQQELVLHLIATHHGRARPHFPADEAFDPDADRAATEAMAVAIPRRFARLQRKYGRWGLAYLESLLRAADWAASAKPSKFLEEDGQ